jgi:hypothetical protein
MRKLLLTSTAIFALGATAAFAELTSDQIVALFPGAQKIEIKRGETTTKVEVIVGTQKIEVIFDNLTDAELKREVTEIVLVDTNGDGVIDANDVVGDDDDENDDDEDDSDDEEDDSDDSEDDSDDEEDDSDDEGDDDSND